MRKRIAAMFTAVVFVMAMAGSALAGNTGYEGQPGGQSNGGGNNGNSGSGYEGQPGNQGN